MQKKSRSQKQENLQKSFNYLTNLPFNRILWFGQFLFRYRVIIAIPFFILLVIFSRPTNYSTAVILCFVYGMAIRFWAAGYLGGKARGNRFSGEHVIVSGPYKYLKHPLYLGNFFLVLGTILLFNPELWLSAVLISVFIIQYSLIGYAEKAFLKSAPEQKVRFDLAKIKGEISTIITILIIHTIYFVRSRFV